MTAFASLSLTNAAAVAVTFNPQSIDPAGVARWYGTQTVYDAKWAISHAVNLPKNGSSVVRIKQRITIPIMDTVDVNKKISEAYLSIEGVLPKNASQLVRTDLRAIATALLAHAMTQASYSTHEGVF